ncbi:hypothetical protein L2819_07520 [Lactobacillus crispatus]|nr:hypothetical protein [Lactobacillus crispatus]MCZ3560481.1 hypothetical protein [Lactobacillus crispatus]
MNKKSGHNIKFKSIFVCTSAIMSLWLGANLTTTQVHAAEDNAAPKSSEVVGQTNSSKDNAATATVQNQSNAKAKQRQQGVAPQNVPTVLAAKTKDEGLQHVRKLKIRLK